MVIFDTPQRYGSISRAFHWGMGLILLILWVVGILIANNLIPQESRKDVVGVHKSIGIIILCIAILRVLWRIWNKNAPSSSKFPWYGRIFSRINTYLFYTLMFVFPLSGIIMTLANGRNLAIFGATIISPFSEEFRSPLIGQYAHQAHETCGYIFIVSLTLHIIGVLFHTVVLKDKLIKRMWGR